MRSASSASDGTPSPMRLSATAQRERIARMNDPAEPLYTMAVACDLLDSDPQTIRRLESLGVSNSMRSGGNHRRYSRNDIVTMGAALDLLGDGVPRGAIPKVLALDAHVRHLQSRLATLERSG